MRRRALFAVAAVFLSVAGLEACVRLLLLLDVIPTQWSRVLGSFQSDPVWFYWLRPNYVGTDAGVPVRHNSFGLRGAETTRVPAPSVVRILVLGESSAYGWRVAEEAAFPAKLQGALRDRMLNCRFEALNAGVPSSSTFQARQWFHERGATLAPDWVLTYYRWNDEKPAATGLPDRQLAGRLAPFVPLLRMLEQTATFPFVRAAWLQWRGVKPDWTGEGVSRGQSRVPAGETAPNLAAICEDAAATGARCGLVIPAYRSVGQSFDDFASPIRLAARLASGGHGATLSAAPIILDANAALPPLSDVNARAPLFIDEMHPNDAGHRLIAEGLASQLEPVFRTTVGGCGARPGH